MKKRDVFSLALLFTLVAGCSDPSEPSIVVDGWTTGTAMVTTKYGCATGRLYTEKFTYLPTIGGTFVDAQRSQGPFPEDREKETQYQKLCAHLYGDLVVGK